MKKEFSFELPFFAGFYESIFYNSDMLYYETKDEDTMDMLREYYKDKKLQPDDIDIDFEPYKKAVCDSFINIFKDYAPDYIKEITYDELISPRQYNFSTDRLFCNVVLADDWRNQVLSFIEKNHDIIADYIYKYNTSYDGFNSYMSNDINDWVKEIKKDDCDERYVSFITKYIMAITHGKNIANVIQMETMDDIHLYEYLISTKEIHKEVE